MGESCVENAVDTEPEPSTPSINSNKDVVAVIPALSKRQLKKLKKQAQWEEKKKEKRRKEREKYKLKRQTAIDKGLPTRTGPSRKELKKRKSENSPNILKVAIDLDYDDLMIDKDVAKCVKQLLRIYTINRRSQTPATIHFTGITEDGRIHESLKKNDGYENWDVRWAFKSYSEQFGNEEIVYLTSDSDSVLDCIDPSKVYIIGGLVDHNHHKGLCHDRAQKLSLTTARLPLNENVDMKTRTVLSTYHVFEILLRLSEGKSWTEAILETIPMRKGAKAKVSTTSSIATATQPSELEDDDEDEDEDSPAEEVDEPMVKQSAELEAEVRSDL